MIGSSAAGFLKAPSAPARSYSASAPAPALEPGDDAVGARHVSALLDLQAALLWLSAHANVFAAAVSMGADVRKCTVLY